MGYLTVSVAVPGLFHTLNLFSNVPAEGSYGWAEVSSL